MSIKYHDLNVGVTLGEAVEPEIVLPSAYQQVEYIEFTPHIAIPVTIPTTDTLYEVDFSCDILGWGESLEESAAFGYRTGNSTNVKDFEVAIYQGNQLTWLRDSSNGCSSFFARNPYTVGNRLVLSIFLNSPRNKALIGGYVDDNSTPWNSFAFDGKIYSIKGTAPTNTKGVGDWNISVWFIPCYRKSDNKPGFYEVISNTFYSDTITFTEYPAGSLIAGPDVN